MSHAFGNLKKYHLCALRQWARNKVDDVGVVVVDESDDDDDDDD